MAPLKRKRAWDLSHARFVSILPDVEAFCVNRCKETISLTGSWFSRPYVTKHKVPMGRATLPWNFYCAFEHSAAKE
jgi:hypothetical protein